MKVDDVITAALRDGTITDAEAGAIIDAANEDRGNPQVAFFSKMEVSALDALVRSQSSPDTLSHLAITPAAAHRIGVCLRRLEAQTSCR